MQYIHRSLPLSETSKPRGPPKAYVHLVFALSVSYSWLFSYVTGLEDRLEVLEALLEQVCPTLYPRIHLQLLTFLFRSDRTPTSLTSWVRLSCAALGKPTLTDLTGRRPNLPSKSHPWRLTCLLFRYPLKNIPMTSRRTPILYPHHRVPLISRSAHGRVLNVQGQILTRPCPLVIIISLREIVVQGPLLLRLTAMRW
jgi:hypothetical protein